VVADELGHPEELAAKEKFVAMLAIVVKRRGFGRFM